MKSANVLSRYFQLLDARDVEGMLALWHPEGRMITRGGTAGLPLTGVPALRAFYEGRGPAVARHLVTSESSSSSASFAEGLVVPDDGGERKFFIASALLDGGLITRYTTLVWEGVDARQQEALTAPRG